MSRVLTIARVELVRLLRDRANIFFVFIFPLLLVVLVGAAFGGGAEQRIGVVGPETETTRAVIDALDASDVARTVDVDDPGDLRDRVARGGLAAGVILPRDPEVAGGRAEVRFVARADGSAQGLRSLVQEAVARRAAVVDAARTVADLDGATVGELLPLARRAEGMVPGVEVAVRDVGEAGVSEELAGLGRFDLGASSQLFLFTFLTSLAASGSLIQTRQLGVARRMLSTPTRSLAILAGSGVGRLLVAGVQAAYIVGATMLLFGVDWGTPLATGAIVAAFCLVSGGAGMLVGATMRNDVQAGGVGVGVGLGAAALGGSMMPLEIFPSALRTLSHVTPHAWANEAMAEIVRRDGGLGDVLVPLAVLLVYGGALYALAAWRLAASLRT